MRKMNTINIADALKLDNTLFVDVRTPAEFAEDHIIGAINIPVFSNDERALVGTIYKKVSQQKAIDAGVEFFSKRLPEIVAKLREFPGKHFVVYCWRGGMRSNAFVSFLKSLKFDITQLDGGYKSFRKHLREALYSFEFLPKLY